MALTPILSRALETLEKTLKQEGWSRSRFYSVENKSGVFGVSGVLTRPGGVGTYAVMTARKDFDAAKTYGHWSSTLTVFNLAESNNGVLLGYLEPRYKIYVFKTSDFIQDYTRTYRPKGGVEPGEPTVEFKMTSGIELHQWLRENP